MAKLLTDISLCMIVRNEEAFLARCLASVKDLVSEMIVVDTGSSDKSKEIAQSFGAKVFDFAWQDDFSAARNFSLEKASGAWILVLDADEAIAPQDLKRLRAFTRKTGQCYSLVQRHYTNEFQLAGFKPCRGEYAEFETNCQGYFETTLVRLFPNTPKLRYEGKIHELVEHAIERQPEFKLVKTDLRIHHYGHLDRQKRTNQKFELYSRLGQAKLDDKADDWKSYYELGVELNGAGRHAEAVEALRKSVELNAQVAASWLNLGAALCQLNRFPEAVQSLLNALRLDPQHAEPYCNLGVAHLGLGDAAKAFNLFLRAVEIKPDYVNALCNMGAALVRLGRYAEAANAYMRALEVQPNCAPAREDLNRLLNNVAV